MRIGIYGGCFNPPHKMHINIVNYLIDNNYLDKVFIVPTGEAYAYKRNMVPYLCRKDMLMMMIDNDNIEISDYEYKDYVVYTIDTLRYFKELYPNDEVYYVCGADDLVYIDKWKEGENILSNYGIIVIDRDGYDYSNVLNNYKANIVVCDMPINSISSTLVKKLIKEKKYNELDKYLDSNVIKYIEEKRLYDE